MDEIPLGWPVKLMLGLIIGVYLIGRPLVYVIDHRRAFGMAALIALCVLGFWSGW